MYNQLIPINKEKLERPHIKWPLVSVLVLILVSVTLFFIDECQKMKTLFLVVEDVNVPTMTTSSDETPEQITAQTYPTNDVTNRNGDDATLSSPAPEWPNADEMRTELEGQGVLTNQEEVKDNNESFVWPDADEMRDIVVGQ
jgi:hypothetical protein